MGNAIYMEPVEGVETVPKNRWKLASRLRTHHSKQTHSRFAHCAEKREGRVYNATTRPALWLSMFLVRGKWDCYKA